MDGDGSGATRYQAASPVLGVTWHASDSLNLYANYGRGFESPTLAEVAYRGAGVPAFNTALNASSSRHYELGAKWLASAQSRLDFTVFQIDLPTSAPSLILSPRARFKWTNASQDS